MRAVPSPSWIVSCYLSAFFAQYEPDAVLNACRQLSCPAGMAQRHNVGTSAAAAGAGAGSEDVQGAMLEPSVVNTPWVRRQQQQQLWVCTADNNLP
jgi:hypothetical protein